VFTPHKPPSEVDDVDPSALALVPGKDAVPVDRGDVCVNVDRGWFEAKGMTPPMKLADLTDPKYKGLLVVQNPTTSSPGLAFLLATVAAFGEDGWGDYWKKLRANDVKVVDSWTTAYQSEFTRAQGGTRPIVVSYGTSPVAEVPEGADPATAVAATDIITDSCFRQVEFAGILRGTKKEAAAGKLIDFMLSDEFQADMPLNMFVFPIRSSVAVPPIFAKVAVLPATPLSVLPASIDANRETWLKTWSTIML
jgi:thiamine transport system substrate-binding protein